MVPKCISPELLQLHLDAFMAVAKDVPGEYWTADHFLREVPDKWRFSLGCFGDAPHGPLLGYAIASRPHPDTVHLHHLMVIAESRGQGVGKQILNELRHRSSAAGAQYVRLKVHKDNLAALRFYEREGFVSAGDQEDYRLLRCICGPSSRIVAIHQPNFLPWCGYFTKCCSADVFVFLDDAQMPGGQSYVYRTQTANKATSQWLSVPIRRTLEQPISAVEFADHRWPAKHLGTLRANYGRAPFFKDVFPYLEAEYKAPGDRLSDFNRRLIRAICQYLGIDPVFMKSSELASERVGDDRLIAIVQALGGTCYLSGKGGQNYQDPLKFAQSGVELRVCCYSPVPYDRGQMPFLPGLSIVDALFYCGRSAMDLLCYPRESKIAC